MESKIGYKIYFSPEDAKFEKISIYRGEQPIIFNNLADLFGEYLNHDKTDMRNLLLDSIIYWEQVRGLKFSAMRLEARDRKIEIVNEIFHILVKGLESDFGTSEKLQLALQSILDTYISNYSDRDFFN